MENYHSELIAIDCVASGWSRCAEIHVAGPTANEFQIKMIVVYQAIPFARRCHISPRGSVHTSQTAPNEYKKWDSLS
jgi:hypothetical protein